MARKGLIKLNKLEINEEILGLLADRYVVIDFVTVDNSGGYNVQIIEMTASLYICGKFESRFHTFIKPHHNKFDYGEDFEIITRNLLSKSPKEKVALKRFTEYMIDILKEQTILCIYDEKINLKFFEQALFRNRVTGLLHYIDISSFAKEVLDLESYDLHSVSQYFNIESGTLFRSDERVEVSSEVLWKLINLKSKMDYGDISHSITDNLNMTSDSIRKNLDSDRHVFTFESLELTNNIINKLNKRFIAFDVETTGLKPNSDRIIEVGAVIFENGKLTKTFSSLVNAGIPISKEASDVNHITNYMLMGAPDEETVYGSLVNFLGDALNGGTIMCAHNATFDMKFLTNTLRRLGYDGKIYFCDTLPLSRYLVRDIENHKQVTLADYFNIKNEKAHRASSDAKTCGQILIELIGLENDNQEIRKIKHDKKKPSDESMKLCAYIHRGIQERGGDTYWLGYCKKGTNMVEMKNYNTFFSFKILKKGKFFIIKKSVAKKTQLKTEPCIASEGEGNVRVYYDKISDVEPFMDYIFKEFKKKYREANKLFKQDVYEMYHYQNTPAMIFSLTDDEIDLLLQDI